MEPYFSQRNIQPTIVLKVVFWEGFMEPWLKGKKSEVWECINDDGTIDRTEIRIYGVKQ